jgi:hypothetical protein
MRSRQSYLAALGTAALLSWAMSVVHASDRTGVYARIDKVVMEPDDRAPQRIQIWGVFSMADVRNPFDYLPAHAGYLYFSLPGNTTLALREWTDLRAVAGTSQIVAFGSRWQPQPTLRAQGEAPQAPDPYPLNVGVMKINGRTDYAPVQALMAFKP